MLAVGVDECYGGAEAGAAVLLAGEAFEQQAFVGRIVVAVRGVACRVYAGFAAQGLHFEPRIIREAVEARART